MSRSFGPVAITLVIACLITAGCGGATAGGADQSTSAQQDATSANQGVGEVGTGQGPAGMDEVGLPVVAALIPELAAVPTPRRRRLRHRNGLHRRPGSETDGHTGRVPRT